MLINFVLIILDVLWCLTMRNVWASKTWNNHTTFAVFDYLRQITLFFSYVNVIIKVGPKPII